LLDSKSSFKPSCNPSSKPASKQSPIPASTIPTRSVISSAL
jgi:hypothetical protein